MNSLQQWRLNRQAEIVRLQREHNERQREDARNQPMTRRKQPRDIDLDAVPVAPSIDDANIQRPASTIIPPRSFRWNRDQYHRMVADQ